MIPIFQSRTAVETFGNCYEACLASILEVPISTVPDRASYLGDPAAWRELVESERAAGRDPLDLEQPAELVEGWSRDLRAWLEERGLELLIGGVRHRKWPWIEEESDVLGSEEEILRLAGRFGGYAIGEWTTKAGQGHAVVMQGDRVVHNPLRGLLGNEGLDRLVKVTIPLLRDVRLFDRHRAEMLPDVAGELERASKMNAIANVQPVPGGVAAQIVLQPDPPARATPWMGE